MLPVSTLASFLFFGSVALSYVAYRILRAIRPLPVAAASNDAGATGSGKMPEGLDDGERSLEQLGRAFTELGLLGLITWLCENKPLFEHAGKIHDMDFFVFIILTAAVVSILFSVHTASKDQGILNRDQTEEWRGFMQMVFLLYHYFALEEVYPLIRLFISCYVFLTGFGNTSFFYLKRDYSIVRLLSMLWRLCFSCLVLAMVHDNPIILYYIVPLHTFYFLVSYFTMALNEKANYSKYGLKTKLVVLGSVLFIVWEFPSVFESVFFLLSDEPHPGAPVGAYGTRYEWQFRSGLDHYSSYFGMIFAAGFPLLELRDSVSVSQSPFLRITLSVIFAALILLWFLVLYPQPKLDFNAKHAYTFVFPLCGYLFLRNLTPYLRRVHLGMFAYAGKYTLETYLLQHHVWLTSNAKTVLVLVPGFPKANFLLVSTLYFLLSVKLYDITVKTKFLLIPSHDGKNAVINLLVLGGFGGICFGIAQVVTIFSNGGIEFFLASLALILLCAMLLAGGVLFVRISTGTNASSYPFLRGLTLIFSVAFFVVGIVCAAFPASPSLSYFPCDPNVGGWVQSFDGLCGQSPQSNFAYCASRGWAWSVMEQRRCGWKRIITLSAVDRIYLVGADPSYAFALAKIEDPTYKNPPGNELLNGKIVRMERPEDLRTKPLQENSLVICQSAETYDACKSRTGGIAILLQESDDIDNTDSNPTHLYTVNANAVKVTAPKADRLSDGRYREEVYDVVIQIALNYVSRALKKPAKASPPPPGGLAHSVPLGLSFLAICLFALFMGDGYLGLAATGSRIFGYEKYVSWEKAMNKVHATIPGLQVEPVASAIPASGQASQETEGESNNELDDTSKLIEKA